MRSLSLLRTVSRVNKDNDTRNRVSVQEQNSLTILRNIHVHRRFFVFECHATTLYISTGCIKINQSKRFYRAATTVMQRRNTTLGLWESTCADQSIGTYVLTRLLSLLLLY